MNYWLLKSEPDDFSIDDLKARGRKGELWNGVRNYQARNFIRDQMKLGDMAFFYHSSCSEVGIVGVAKVISNPIADPDQFDPKSNYFDPKATRHNPRWWCPRVEFHSKFKRCVSLKEIKASSLLKTIGLIKYSRLSVMPIDVAHWALIMEMSNS